MGRKKKSQVEEPKKEIKVETPVNSVSYTGVINVSLQKGKKTYFNKTFRNKGRWPLFYFLNMCLRGDYGNAEMYRPKYINAFGNEDWEGEPEPDISDENTSIRMSQYFSERSRITVSSYPYMSLPDVEKEIVRRQSDTNEPLNIGSSTITYKFNIPFTQITDIHHVNAFALYAAPVKSQAAGTTAIDDIENPCAFFFILDEDRNVINLMDGLEEADLGDEYNLYIEWTLSISNSQYKSSNNIVEINSNEGE